MKQKCVQAKELVRTLATECWEIDLCAFRKPYGNNYILAFKTIPEPKVS